MKLVLIAGSNSGRKSREVVRIADELIKEVDQEMEVSSYDLSKIEMSIADGRNYLDYGGEFTTLLSDIMEADAILISTPVYNGGIPSALINLLDALPEKSLLNKAVGIILTAGSGNHYLVPEYQLKPILAYLKAQILPSYVMITDKSFSQGKIIDGDVRFRMKDLIFDLVLLTRGLSHMEEEEEKLLGF